MRSPSNSKTAVLIFAHSSQEELKHKAISKETELFDALTYGIIKTVEKTGFPYFHVSEEQQIGATFGERFTHAIQYVFDQGYESVITVGNDTPHLNAKHIIDASAHLTSGKLVIGPSADGGFYLMGLHASFFNSKALIDLPWQSSGLYRSICSLAIKEEQEIKSLTTLFDIDEFQDLKRLFNYGRGLHARLLSILKLIFSSKTPIYSDLSVISIRSFNATPFNKGSPVS